MFDRILLIGAQVAILPMLLILMFEAKARAGELRGTGFSIQKLAIIANQVVIDEGAIVSGTVWFDAKEAPDIVFLAVPVPTGRLIPAAITRISVFRWRLVFRVGADEMPFIENVLQGSNRMSTLIVRRDAVPMHRCGHLGLRIDQANLEHFFVRQLPVSASEWERAVSQLISRGTIIPVSDRCLIDPMVVRWIATYFRQKRLMYQINGGELLIAVRERSHELGEMVSEMVPHTTGLESIGLVDIKVSTDVKIESKEILVPRTASEQKILYYHQINFVKFHVDKIIVITEYDSAGTKLLGKPVLLSDRNTIGEVKFNVRLEASDSFRFKIIVIFDGGSKKETLWFSRERDILFFGSEYSVDLTAHIALVLAARPDPTRK